MSSQRIGGIILLLVGIGLLVVGLNASDSVADRMSRFFTGHYTDQTVWYLLGGAVAALGGFMMLAFSARFGRT